MSIYTMGGPHSGYEKDFNKRISSIKDSMDKSSKRISKILNDALKNPQITNAYWKKVRSDLNKEYKKMYTVYESWAVTNFPQVYRNSLRDINKQINRMRNVTNKAKKTVEELIKSNGTRLIVNNLYRDALSSWGTALQAGRANLYRFTRLTQQGIVQESLIDTAVAEAIESGNLRNFTPILAGKSAQYKKLLEAVNAGRYVQAGSKKYDAAYYAEMVGRTKFHEAQAAATLQQCGNYDTDLIVVSSHNTTTVICQQYEGKIFSISGKDPRFPRYTEAPPFHTNCLHLIFPQFESALIANASLEEFSKFSKGKISKPPYPSNFKPIDDREAV